MANEAQAIGLLALFVIGGFFIGFNLVENYLGFELGLGLNDITNFQTGLWIVVARLVGIALIIIPSWVIYQILRG